MKRNHLTVLNDFIPVIIYCKMQNLMYSVACSLCKIGFMLNWVSGSQRIFTGIYCSVIFSLTGISILETILVNFLMAKGKKNRSVETTDAITG